MATKWYCSTGSALNMLCLVGVCPGGSGSVRQGRLCSGPSGWCTLVHGSRPAQGGTVNMRNEGSAVRLPEQTGILYVGVPDAPYRYDAIGTCPAPNPRVRPGPVPEPVILTAPQTAGRLAPSSAA